MKISLHTDDMGNLGFDIRGGSEHGIPVFVCQVDEGSEAMEKGLVPGYIIQKVNGVSFEHISREEAMEVRP